MAVQTRVERAVWATAWEMRLTAALSSHPALAGSLFAAGCILPYVLIETLLGELSAETTLGFGFGSVAAGYALGAGYAVNAGNGADFEELRPHLRGAHANPITREVNLTASRIVGVFGILGSTLFVYAVDEPAYRLLSGQSFTGDGVLSLVLIGLAFWFFLRAAYFTIAGLRATVRVVERDLHIDPLDLAPLAPLGRMALRSAVLWIGAAAIVSLAILLTGGTVMELVTALFLVCIAVGAFVIPVRGVHRRIRAAKRQELTRVRVEIRRDRESVAALAGEASAAAARLPGLLAWERRIESAREWPFDTTTLVRFALLLTVPLFSWLGGALMERALDRVLD